MGELFFRSSTNLVLDLVDAKSCPVADARVDVEGPQTDDDAAGLELELVWRHSRRELIVEDRRGQVGAEGVILLRASVDALEEGGRAGEHLEDLNFVNSL